MHSQHVQSTGQMVSSEGKLGPKLFKNVQGCIIDELALSKVISSIQCTYSKGEDEGSARPRSSKVRQEEQEKSGKQP